MAYILSFRSQFSEMKGNGTVSPVTYQCDARHIGRRLRISGVLLILGLTVEVTSLLWIHPTAFLVFLSVDGVAIAAGIVIYLYSLIPPWPPTSG